MANKSEVKMNKVDEILMKTKKARTLQVSVAIDPATKKWLEQKAEVLGTSLAAAGGAAIVELKEREQAEVQPA